MLHMFRVEIPVFDCVNRVLPVNGRGYAFSSGGSSGGGGGNF